MNDIQKILEQLSKGEITQEEAQRLLSLPRNSNIPSQVMSSQTGNYSDQLGDASAIRMPWDLSPTRAQGPVDVGSLGTGINLPTNQYSTVFNPTSGGGDGTTQQTSTASEKTPYDFKTRDEYVTYRNEQGYDPQTASEEWDNYIATGPTQNKTVPGTADQGAFAFPYIYPGGSDISTELYSLGRAIGAPTGAQGRIASGVGAAGAALFDAARNVASGIGYERQNQYVENEYRRRQKEVNYVPQAQYQNANYLGGFYGKNGGLFEEGGAMSDPAPAGMQMPAEQSQQQDQGQQILQMVAQAIQAGQTPEQVVQALVQKGMPQAQAEQAVAMVMESMSAQGAPAESAMPTMKDGGTFKHKVGDTIEFRHGGKMKKGVIKKIENGQIYL